MGEVAIVEELARARKSYLRALEALRQHYVERGNATKAKWAETEIEAFSKVPDLRYLTISEIAGPELKPLRTIEAADALYKEGLDYKNYPAFPPSKKDYLKRALEKFETIIQKYPDSDKIDDAAFRMGEIYGGWYFEDWTRAVLAYERCWQWDPKTDYPAVFNAAKIYDEKLQNRVKAVELYNRVIAESNNQDLQNQARQRIKALTGK
jgi:tetratricopeptide (TPR) repeat protein